MKCCDITAGMLKEPVTFQRQGAGTNTGGNFVPGAWATIAGAPTRAFVKALSGFERAASDRTDAQVKMRVVVRYVSGLRDADSVLIRGRRHNIRFINNVEFADKWLAIDVDGGVAV